MQLLACSEENLQLNIFLQKLPLSFPLDEYTSLAKDSVS